VALLLLASAGPLPDVCFFAVANAVAVVLQPMPPVNVAYATYTPHAACESTRRHADTSADVVEDADAIALAFANAKPAAKIIARMLLLLLMPR